MSASNPSSTVIHASARLGWSYAQIADGIGSTEQRVIDGELYWNPNPLLDLLDREMVFIDVDFRFFPQLSLARANPLMPSSMRSLEPLGSPMWVL